jgi:8-oxo-dGTP pyrophosphatase MutT (NUDIX family)
VGSVERSGAEQESQGEVTRPARDQSHQPADGQKDTHRSDDLGPATTDTGKKYTPETRRRWFKEQFDNGTLDPENLQAAKVVITNEKGHVLTLQAPYEQNRTIPGGWVDNGTSTRETPEQAAAREVREELGVNPVIEGVLVVNKKSADPAHGRDYPMTDLIFGASVPEPSKLRPDGKEVQDYAFLPPQEAVQAMGRKGVDVSAAMEARRSEKTLVLEDGKRAEPPAS